MAAYFPLPTEDNGLYEIYNTFLYIIPALLFFQFYRKICETTGIFGRENLKKIQRIREIFVHAHSSKYKNLYIITNISISNISLPWNIFFEMRKRNSIL